MFILKLIIAVIVGFAGHQTCKPTVDFGPRWGSLTRSVVGVLMFLPVFVIVKRSIPEKSGDFGDAERDIVAGLITAGALATGVFSGHVIDEIGMK